MATSPEGVGAAAPWSVAWERAGFGPGGFYTDGAGARDGPSRFFRTSVHVGATFHRALASLLLDVDERLGRPAVLDLVDVGSGRGELLSGMLQALPSPVAARVRAVGVDVHEAPAGLDSRITWLVGTAPAVVPRGVSGLLVANEWLDDVPLDVVELGPDGTVRLVLVEPDGTEHDGPSIDDDAAWAAWGLDAHREREWLALHWPLELGLVAPGTRAEIGLARDDAWTAAVDRLDSGTALAIDYGHRSDRRPAAAPHPTLTGYYRAGRAVAPVPDGSVNITAHVAVDSVAGAVGATATRQRESLLAQGVSGRLPDRELASTDAGAYAEALEAASDGGELLDPAGLGGFWWIRLDR